MAFTINTSYLEWHEGELEMQKVLPGPKDRANPTNMMLSPPAAALLSTAPLIAVGTLDSKGRLWSTLWGGAGGMSQQLGHSIIGIKTRVDKKHDPVVWALMDGQVDGELVKEEGAGKMMSGLPIDLAQRRRQKLFGRKIAGAVMPGKDDQGETPERGDNVGELQMAVRIDQSMGNCPKYLNARNITPAMPQGKLISDDCSLPQEALDIIAQADMLFISSANHDQDMDTNHRGGPPGFIRATQSADDGTWQLIWPEYSGNGFYSTLGNLQVNPQAGVVIPDFDTGNVVYVTGRTEVLVGKDAASVIPRSFAAIRLRVDQARVVLNGLPFRGELIERSPYNPKVRQLIGEKKGAGEQEEDNSSSGTPVRVVSQEQITPSISRFKFALLNDGDKTPAWKPGQWVALDLSAELDVGWSHMMDDDPQALNDDYIRTFTVSSSPPAQSSSFLKADVAAAAASSGTTVVQNDPTAMIDEFEITIRLVGNATRWLFRQRGGRASGVSSIDMRGFGGADINRIDQSQALPTAFVAAGIGITPVLSQLPFLDLARFSLFWTLRLEDIDLVADMLDRWDSSSSSSSSSVGGSDGAATTTTTNNTLVSVLRLFFTGVNESLMEQKRPILDRLEAGGAKVLTRRMAKHDLELDSFGNRWYCCVTPPLYSVLADWLGAGPGGATSAGATARELIFEDFY